MTVLVVNGTTPTKLRGALGALRGKPDSYPPLKSRPQYDLEGAQRALASSLSLRPLGARALRL